MAIQNASDLLVYAKTTAAVAQVTRIRVLTDSPLIDFTSGENILLSNITNSSGVITDNQIVSGISNTGQSILDLTKNMLNSSYGYSITSVATDPTNNLYKYIDVTNGAVGIVPTLEFSDGTATFDEDAVIIEIVTPGSSAIFDPVAYSTSASFSTNLDLRDITTKDSAGWSESRVGLKSFEISTEVLQSINPDVPLDGTDFFHELSERDEVNLSFSDRIRNIIRTNLTQSGVDGFTLSTSAITQSNLQTDAFGGNTGSKLTITGVNTFKSLNYSVDSARIQGKYVTWSFYVKGDPLSPNNDTATFWSRTNNADVVPESFEIISGDGTVSNLTSSNVKKVVGLNTGANNVAANWTKIRITYKIEGVQSASTAFLLAPGLANDQVANDIIYTSSWQIEFKDEVTDYQDPTDITHWQGNALVSSVSFDAGVEDNLTCSATFTGTGNVYSNGLGPELIGDTGFDNPSYWTVNPGLSNYSVVENGYGKILSPSGSNTFIQGPASMMTIGSYYQLTYTVSSSPTPLQNFRIFQGWEASPDVDVICSGAAGTHTVLFKAGRGDLIVKRDSTSGETKIWLSSISLKKIL